MILAGVTVENFDDFLFFWVEKIMHVPDGVERLYESRT